MNLLISSFTKSNLSLFLSLFGITIHSYCLIRQSLKYFSSLFPSIPLGRPVKSTSKIFYSVPSSLFLLPPIYIKSPLSLSRLQLTLDNLEVRASNPLHIRKSKCNFPVSPLYPLVASEIQRTTDFVVL